MSTGYGWEGLRQAYATLLGARLVPERPCGGLVYLGRYNKCSPLPFLSVILRRSFNTGRTAPVALMPKYQKICLKWPPKLSIGQSNMRRIRLYNSRYNSNGFGIGFYDRLQDATLKMTQHTNVV